MPSEYTFLTWGEEGSMVNSVADASVALMIQVAQPYG